MDENYLIKEAIYFWMSDRAGDTNTFLKRLDVDDGKALKCCVHIILCADCVVRSSNI